MMRIWALVAIVALISGNGRVRGDADLRTIDIPCSLFHWRTLGVTHEGGDYCSLMIANYLVGDSSTGAYYRSIIPFRDYLFNMYGVAGQPLESATLNFSVAGDSLEPGDSFVSEVRLFSIDIPDITIENRNAFAAVTSDAGSYAVVGHVAFDDGVTGPRSISFGADALDALYDAINGGDATVGIAFREFQGNGPTYDMVNPDSFSLAITLVPEPGMLSVVVFGGLLGLRGRRRQPDRPVQGVCEPPAGSRRIDLCAAARTARIP